MTSTAEFRFIDLFSYPSNIQPHNNSSRNLYAGLTTIPLKSPPVQGGEDVNQGAIHIALKSKGLMHLHGSLSGRHDTGGVLDERELSQPGCEVSGDPDELLALAAMRMPFGKYHGRFLIDLPEPYVVWFANKGFQEGRLGRMLQAVYGIKLNHVTLRCAPPSSPYPAINVR
jgi:uncharacterized protein (DUF3820 family)